MPLGPIAFNPSAMNRNDAPQMSPGIAISSQSADKALRFQLDLCISSFIRITPANASRTYS
jgi:hypothetical protein